MSIRKPEFHQALFYTPSEGRVLRGPVNAQVKWTSEKSGAALWNSASRAEKSGPRGTRPSEGRRMGLVDLGFSEMFYGNEGGQ